MQAPQQRVVDGHRIMAAMFQKDSKDASDWCLLRATSAVAGKMGLNPDLAEDMVQDALILMMRDEKKLPGLRFTGQIIRWRLLEALKNHSRRERKQRLAKEAAITIHAVRTQPSRGTEVNSKRYKRHCRRGHLKEGSNLYLQPKTGVRFCRACQRINRLKFSKKGTEVNGEGFKRYCKRGHLKEGSNLYVQPKTGARSCRACMKISYEKRKKVT